MAIVVKEASNTPLELGRLAESLSNVYLGHLQQKSEQRRWEQEATWRNEDRDRLNQNIADFEALPEGTFTSPAYQAAAKSDLLAGRSWGGNLPSSANAWDKAKDFEMIQQYYANQGITDPTKLYQSTIDQLYGISQVKQDANTFSTKTMDPARASGGYDPNIGSTDYNGTWTSNFAGGSGDTTVGGPTMTPGEGLKTVTNEQDYQNLAPGERYIGPDGNIYQKGG